MHDCHFGQCLGRQKWSGNHKVKTLHTHTPLYVERIHLGPVQIKYRRSDVIYVLVSSSLLPLSPTLLFTIFFSKWAISMSHGLTALVRYAAWSRKIGTQQLKI